MMKQLLSLIIAVLLVCSACARVPSAHAEDPVTTINDFYGRKADNSTMDSWMDLFGPNINNTANVGTVWTDKTVTEETPEGYNFPMKDDNTNFMVTLSTLSATMSITGHETLPTDTVFVLDLSSSMYRITVDGTAYKYSTHIVGKMIKAVNDTIHDLLTMNPLNRVGVVIYYGDPNLDPQSNSTHAVKLLSLDNYEPLPDAPPEYLKMEIQDSITYTIKIDNIDTEVEEKNALMGIKVNDSLKIRNSNKYAIENSDPYVMPGQKAGSPDNIAGTYMQLGLELARDMFMNAITTIPANAGFQAGATRIPILVLMSDGEPTAASKDFHNVAPSDGTTKKADMGNNTVGERSPAETDFLTQLTASYTRQQIDSHYIDTTPLFYTLGLETNSVSYDVMNPQATDLQHANSSADHNAYFLRTGRAVKNYNKDLGNTHPSYQNTPAVVNAKIDYYWNQLLNHGSVILPYLDALSSWQTSYDYWETKSVTVNKHNGFPSSYSDKYYVDSYFSANTADDLETAFKSLVDEIILQSEYYPTYVENGAIGMSGYVDFHDEIGNMMEVKQVHGLARKATARELQYIEDLGKTAAGKIEQAKIKLENGIIYYRGEQIAKYFQQNMYDNTRSAEDKAEITRVLTKLFHTRLGLPETDAQILLNQIISTKAIYYNSDTVFSNSFTWYADANETYIPDQTLGVKPDGAAYKITSYWYASPYDLENTNSFIRIKTDLRSATQKQCVTWSVPASMIPLVRYQVNLSGDELAESDTGITVAYKNNFPMRAFFEVGLRHDVDKYNAVEKLKELNYEANEGKYTFWSNAWKPDALNPNPDNLHTAGNTVVTFRPSEQNERYFITSDMPLYNQNGEDWTSGDAYVKLPVFYTKDNNNNSIDPNGEWDITIDSTTPAVLQLQLEKIPAGSADDSYVDIHTPRSAETRIVTKAEKQVDGKTPIPANQTGTLSYSIYENPPRRDENRVIAILGNNGIFHFTADTGIAITKSVLPGEGITADANDTFTFVIKPTGETPPALVSGTNYALDIIAADGTVTEGSTQVTAEGTLVVQLKHGETAYLAGSVVDGADPAGLPTGTYSVTEQITGQDGAYFYNVTGIKVDGVSPKTKSSNTVNVTVTEFEVTQVDFTNQPVKTGCIKISKAVTTDSNITAPDKDFTFEVQLNKDIHQSKTFTMIHSTKGASTITADDTGKLTLSLKAGETATIGGIAAENPVTVTVKEVNLPEGFAVTEPSDGEDEKTVNAGETVTFAFANAFTPASVSLSGHKTLNGRKLNNEEFSFVLHEADENFTAGEALQTVKNTEDGSFSFSDLTYTAIGIHYYVVKELVPESPLNNVDYSDTQYKIKVDVTNSNGKLVAAVTDETGAELATSKLDFTNTYTPAAAGITLTGSKTISGRPLVNGEFTFTLTQMTDDSYATPVTGQTSMSATNTDGVFSFALSYNIDQAGKTFYYVVKETAAAPESGVTIDSTEYRVQVGVTYDNNTGILAALPLVYKVVPSAEQDGQPTIEAVEDKILAFVNSYQPASVDFTLSGTKSLIGRTLAEKEFTFELYETADENSYTAIGESLRANNAADGSITFPAITYMAPGTHYYVVREVIPENDADKLPSVTYDGNHYRVKVTVTDDQKGQLVTSAEYKLFKADSTSTPATGILFTNIYEAVDSKLVITGTKVLNGIRELKVGDFSFALYAANKDFNITSDAIDTASNDASGVFRFDAITYTEAGTHYYVVKEVIPESPIPGVTYDTREHHITVVVSDNTSTGQLVPDADLVYEATYFTVDPTQPALLDVNTPPVHVETFSLPENPPSFSNSYDAKDTDITFSGTKALIGRDLLAGEFSFELYEVADDRYDITGVTPVPATNQLVDGKHVFTFPKINYTDAAAGTHYYVVKEKIPTPVDSQLPSVTYDESIYNIQVVVEDNENGELSCNPTYTKVTATGEAIVENIEFTNIYEARDSAIVISGTKMMNGIRPIAEDEFKFELLQTESDFATIIEGTTAQQVTNKLVNGKHTFTFAPLEHTAAGTYYYVVKEVPGTLPGVSYDPCEYHITVKVTDNPLTSQLVPELVGDAVKVDPTKANVLTVNTPAQITLPVNQLVFTNAYDTEDTSVTFSGTKDLTGRPAASGEFTFELYKTDSDYVIDEEAKLVSTTTNNVTETSNTFSFPAIPYSDQDVGEHYYVIVEKDTGALGVEYDTTRYQIQVTVSDTVDAKLTTAITGIPEGGLVFTNTYAPTDTSFTFSGTKTLNGRKIAADEFRFTLYQASLDTEGKFVIGEAIQTVSNNETGEFVFSTLPNISAAGTYHYIVKEEEGTLPGVTYDKTEYHITVEVVDNGAALRPTATVTKFTPSAQEPPAADGAALFAVRPDPIPLTVKDLHFTNVYDALDTSVTFSGTKTLSGRSMNAGEFQFSLFKADNEYNPIGLIETVQNTAEGTFAFSDIPLNAAGIYHYVILEQRGPLAAMTYDSTEYHIEVIVIDVNAVLQKSVTITIKDDLSGTTVSPDALTFHNAHDETDAVVVFSGTKTFQGHHLAQNDFTFTLYSADAQFNVIAPLMNTANAADGSFAFKPMVYAQPGTWHYVVREDRGSQSYIDYDQAEYRITVNVWNNNGVLIADVSAVRVLGNESTPANALGGLAFTNLYTPASVTVPFPGNKVYQGAELTEGLFTFQLYAADPLFQPIGAPLETVTNGADGSFAFTPRIFHTAGVYRFLVLEDATLPIPNVVYDPTVYHVTVTVTDNGVGALDATVQVTTSEGLIAEMPVFENAFWATPDTGDHSELETMLALCLTSLAALTALMFFSRRKVRI